MNKIYRLGVEALCFFYIITKNFVTAKFLTIILKNLVRKGSDTMYSFRARAKMSAEEREKYQSKKTREEMLAEYLAVSEDFAKDDSSVDSVDSSETLVNVDVPF